MLVGKSQDVEAFEGDGKWVVWFMQQDLDYKKQKGLNGYEIYGIAGNKGYSICIPKQTTRI